jgi:hypothetical protein
LVTTLTVVIVGVEQGILLAIVLSLVDHTRYGYRPKNAVLRGMCWSSAKWTIRSHAQAKFGFELPFQA